MKVKFKGKRLKVEGVVIRSEESRGTAGLTTGSFAYAQDDI